MGCYGIGLAAPISVAIATRPDHRPPGEHVTKTFSSDYGVEVEYSSNSNMALFVRGCIWEPAELGGEAGREEWLYTYHLRRYFTPESRRDVSTRVAARACVFVERGEYLSLRIDVVRSLATLLTRYFSYECPAPARRFLSLFRGY